MCCAANAANRGVFLLNAFCARHPVAGVQAPQRCAVDASRGNVLPLLHLLEEGFSYPTSTPFPTRPPRRPEHVYRGISILLALPAVGQALECYGQSHPSSQALLGFTVSGRVTEVMVRDGDFVNPGDVLAEQDGSVLDARIAQYHLESESVVEIEASKAELAQREQDLKKIRQAHDKGAATDLELEQAGLEVVISEFRVKAAEEKKAMAGLKLAEAEEEREQLYLKSPIKGRIESLKLTAGEAPKPMEPVLMVVNCDPLWIEVPTPLAQATPLEQGRELTVRFPDGGSEQAEVLFISSVADSASDTVAVRLVLPNPDNRRAGERITVILP